MGITRERFASVFLLSRLLLDHGRLNEDRHAAQPASAHWRVSVFTRQESLAGLVDILRRKFQRAQTVLSESVLGAINTVTSPPWFVRHDGEPFAVSSASRLSDVPGRWLATDILERLFPGNGRHGRV